MESLPTERIDVKLLREKRRFEPLRATSDGQTWRAECMHLGCGYREAGLQTADAATTVAQFHADSTGHPVKLHATIEFSGGIVRSQIEAR